MQIPFCREERHIIKKPDAEPMKLLSNYIGREIMRKMIAGGLALLLLLLSGATTAFAAENMEETPSGIAYTELEGRCV